MAGVVSGFDCGIVAEVVRLVVSAVVSGWVSSMVRQVMCAVVAVMVYELVAEVVCALVALMMPAANCGTAAEMVAAMVFRTKTGTLVPMPGDALGARQAGVRMSVRSAAAWRRSSLATPNQMRTELSGASARVTTELHRSASGTAFGQGWDPTQTIVEWQVEAWRSGRTGVP